MSLVRRLVATLLVAGLGLVIALVVDVFITDIYQYIKSPAYFLLAVSLLAVGLFSCTYDIDIDVFRGNARLILVAVTLGVLAKAAIIAGVMYLVLGDDPTYLVLAMAVAQIDPLSVAVMRRRTWLSRRAKAILWAWSSFDDPVTAILTIYLSAVVVSLNDTTAAVSPDAFRLSDVTFVWRQLHAFGNNLLGNALLVAGAAVIWLLLWWISKRKGYSITNGAEPGSRALRAAGILTLPVIAVVAVANYFMLGLAVIGLFFRPGIGRFIAAVTPIAFLLATFVLGLVLADDINLVPGLVLGLAAFLAQVVVGTVVARSLPRSDRIGLALGQQSGITAVILALLLETLFPGTVAVVAPAIIVVNLLHLITNIPFDRARARRDETPWPGMPPAEFRVSS